MIPCILTAIQIQDPFDFRLDYNYQLRCGLTPQAQLEARATLRFARGLRGDLSYPTRFDRKGTILLYEMFHTDRHTHIHPCIIIIQITPAHPTSQLPLLMGRPSNVVICIDYAFRMCKIKSWGRLFTMHYAEKYMGVRHGSFWFCMSAPIKKKASHIFTQQGSETCRLKAKFDAPNVHSSLQLQFIFKESKFKIKYYLASTRSPHSV